MDVHQVVDDNGDWMASVEKYEVDLRWQGFPPRLALLPEKAPLLASCTIVIAKSCSTRLNETEEVGGGEEEDDDTDSQVVEEVLLFFSRRKEGGLVVVELLNDLRKEGGLEVVELLNDLLFARGAVVVAGRKRRFSSTSSGLSSSNSKESPWSCLRNSMTYLVLVGSWRGVSTAAAEVMSSSSRPPPAAGSSCPDLLTEIEFVVVVGVQCRGLLPGLRRE